MTVATDETIRARTGDTTAFGVLWTCGATANVTGALSRMAGGCLAALWRWRAEERAIFRSGFRVGSHEELPRGYVRGRCPVDASSALRRVPSGLSRISNIQRPVRILARRHS